MIGNIRALPESFDPGVVAEIDRRLAGVADTENVAIPWAIESGSRAWGFPSPDSDYDCRFLYIRSADAYLSPWLDRDVIETPLDKVYDVKGWDLRKAIQLLVKGNASVNEWLRSPHVYTGESSFRAGLLALADRVADHDAVGRHYTHVGRGQWERHAGGAEIPLKTIFYALRPAASVRWLQQRPEASTPPMELVPLLVESGAAADVLDLVTELIALKAVTHEMGQGVAPRPLAAYISEALDFGETLFSQEVEPDSEDRRREAAAFFRSAVAAYAR